VERAGERAIIDPTFGQLRYSGLPGTEYLGIRSTSCIIARCSDVLWYGSPGPWALPDVWMFGFDEQGQGVARYEYSSP
jgi:hypothetical protein